MRKSLSLGLLAAIAMFAAGCTATGKWELRSVEPSAARADFKPHLLTLQQDKTYYADTDNIVTTGVWTWEGSIADGLLVLNERAGSAKSYKAKMPSNARLILQTDVDGTPAKATYGRRK